ncbi:MAG: hypothetical protein LBH59_09360 [Planctomycetaceae bacterium]|nr:hypothetical protein [Planctomycetaceae bacterium]
MFKGEAYCPYRLRYTIVFGSDLISASMQFFVYCRLLVYKQVSFLVCEIHNANSNSLQKVFNRSIK